MGVCICVYMYTYRFASANAASIMVCNGIVCMRAFMCVYVRVCVCVCVCVCGLCARGSCINLCVYLIGLPLDCGHTLLHIMLSACF